MTDIITYPFLQGLPNQFIPIFDKIGTNDQPSDFGKACMNYFDSIASIQTEEKQKDYKNYLLYSGKYDYSDYDYVTKPFDEDFGELPANLRHYAIASPPIKTLWGEMKQMPFNYICKAEDQDSKNEFNRTKSELLHQYVQSQILQELQAKGVNVQDQNAVQTMSPPYIQEYMTRSYTSNVEMWANYSLKYEIKKNLIKNKFLTGYLDGLICAKEFYLTTIVNEKPVFEVLNPLYVFYDKGVDVKFIDDGEYAGIRIPMTISQIMSNWSSDMSQTQIDKLLRFEPRRSMFYSPNKGIDSLEFDLTDRQLYYSNTPFNINPGVDYVADALFTTGSSYTVNKIPVTIAYWKSKRKIGYLHFLDQQGIEQIDIVDENYTEDKSSGEWIEWDWVNQVWEGVKIGFDIYLNIRPLSYQGVSLDKPKECKLPITGGIYNNRNSRPTSLLDEMKPYQEAYNIYMYKLEQDFNSELGKITFMSLRHIPNRKGWDEKKWLWYLKAMKIAWVDDSIENLNGTQSQFSHFQTADATLGDSIQHKINVLEWLKNECNYIAGVTPQRLGEIASSETVGGVERAVHQSVTQSEIYFQTHNEIVQKALTNYLNVCQYAYRNGKDLSFVLDDMTNAFVKIDGGKFELADIGVFVTDSSEDYRVLNALRSLAQPAMQNGADLSDIAILETTDSIREIKQVLEKIKQERLEHERQTQQIEQQKIAEMQRQFEVQRQDDNMNKQLDRESNERIAQMKALGEAELNNPEGTGEIENQAQLALQISELEHQKMMDMNEHLLKQKGLTIDAKNKLDEINIKKQELELKKKELEHKTKDRISKERIEKDKLKTEKAKMKNDLLLGKMAARVKSKTK